MAQDLDLSSYSSIQQSLFVKMTLPDSTILLVSTHDTAFDIDGDTYEPLGLILGVSEFNNDLKPTENDVTITFSGVDSSNLTGIMDYFNRTSYGANSLKGAPVEIRRAFFDVNTGLLLDITGNPSLRFTGVINNYSLNDEYTQGSDTTTTTISLSCSSIMSVLARKISGRKTNRASMDLWYPQDFLEFTGSSPAGLQTGTGFSVPVEATTTGGAIQSTGVIRGGSGYTDGSYTSVTVRGTETGAANATANVTVTGGTVTYFFLTNTGTGYRGPDKSFDRVAVISKMTFDFGKPYST